MYTYHTRTPPPAHPQVHDLWNAQTYTFRGPSAFAFTGQSSNDLLTLKKMQALQAAATLERFLTFLRARYDSRGQLQRNAKQLRKSCRSGNTPVDKTGRPSISSFVADLTPILSLNNK